MRSKHVVLPFILLLLASAFARADGLQTTTFTKTGQGVTFSLVGTGVQYHHLTWTKTGTVTVCSVRVDSSADGITWNVGDIIAAQNCASSGQSATTNFVVAYTRVNMLSFTGTGTVTISYNVYVNNPVTVASIYASGGVTANTIPKSNGAGLLVDSILCDQGNSSNAEIFYSNGGCIEGDVSLQYDKGFKNIDLAGAFKGSAFTGVPLTPSIAPILSITNGAAGAYTYGVCTLDNNGGCSPSATASTVVGPTTLSGSDFIQIGAWTESGAASCDIYRVAGGATQGKIGNIACGSNLTDTGLAGGGETFPAVNTSGSAVFSSRYPLCPAGEAWVSNGTIEACSTVISAIPPTTPPSLGTTNLTLTIANDTVTGTTTNKLVKLTSTGKAIITTAGDITGIVGICVSGCGTTGDAQVTVLGLASCVSDNSTTILHQLVPSSSVNGDCSDAGTTYPTGILVVGQSQETGTAGTRKVFISTDFASASNPGGGKGQNITINGTSPKIIANFNNSTPSAPGGNTNVTWQVSTSGNTTSVSGYVPTGGATTTTHVYPLQDCVADTVTNPGNSFYTVTALTNFKNYGHWEFLLNTAAEVDCQAYIPHTVAGTPAAKIRLVLAANDGTAAHTDGFQTCDSLVSTTINVGSFTCPSAQNFTTTSTAYAPVTLDFVVQATVTADSLLDIQIKQAASNSVTANVFAKVYLVIDETE